MKQPESILRLINKFSKLPGVGAKTAARYAYYVVDLNEQAARELCESIMDVKERVRLCGTCFNLSESEVCPICSSRGDSNEICVVAYPKDILAIEKTGFKGKYHVLHGTLSPIDGRGVESIRIKELLSRLDGVDEVIMATNPDIEGEATSIYISKLLKPFGVKVSRLAQGVSLGSDIEYTDEVTLIRALEARTEL